ncbi:hypothetical protein [Bradyrhizobium sp.]|jgi:hypothetical protein|uniref:hypothetical protein n=1 Tax=Bradyrhizobium sp. TaxID=376 RepID=UPI003C15CF51
MLHDHNDDHLAEIWRSAQHRRTEDLYFWFTHLFQRQLHLGYSEPRFRHARRRAAALLSKLLEATRAVSRTGN